MQTVVPRYQFILYITFEFCYLNGAFVIKVNDIRISVNIFKDYIVHNKSWLGLREMSPCVHTSVRMSK